jgi:hypothetical protein
VHSNWNLKELQVWRHIFTGPASVLKKTPGPASGKRCNAQIHGMTRVTPRSIAYAAVQVRVSFKNPLASHSIVSRLVSLSVRWKNGARLMVTSIRNGSLKASLSFSRILRKNGSSTL